MIATKITVTTKSRTINLLLITWIAPTLEELANKIREVLGDDDEVLQASTTEVDKDTLFIL